MWDIYFFEVNHNIGEVKSITKDSTSEIQYFTHDKRMKIWEKYILTIFPTHIFLDDWWTIP